MTKKRVIFSHHAKREMRKARIKRTDVLAVLWTGTRRITKQTGTVTYWGRLAYIPKHRPIEVVYVEYPNLIVVVTVYEKGKYD